ncbi:MAG: hypothetical protein ACKV2V_09745 [Blastocatellia bacterium]
MTRRQNLILHDPPQRDPAGRRNFLRHSLTAGVAGLFGLWSADTTPARPLVVVDQPATHNMLIVGQQTVFLSHLPMFSEPGAPSPHRYQAILEASFTKAAATADALYFNDRRKNPGVKIYTLNPGEFILPDMMRNPAPAAEAFRAKVFRGHLERPTRKLLLPDVGVKIRRVVHFREFTPAATAPDHLEYILFGKGKELFLAHRISRAPDFDQVLAITASGHNLTDEELGKGLRVIVDRPNALASRLTEKQEAPVEVREAPGGASLFRMTVKVLSELYFEEGELRVPADFDSTEAEKKAKFP